MQIYEKDVFGVLSHLANPNGDFIHIIVDDKKLIKSTENSFKNVENYVSITNEKIIYGWKLMFEKNKNFDSFYLKEHAIIMNDSNYMYCITPPNDKTHLVDLDVKFVNEDKKTIYFIPDFYNKRPEANKKVIKIPPQSFLYKEEMIDAFITQFLKVVYVEFQKIIIQYEKTLINLKAIDKNNEVITIEIKNNNILLNNVRIEDDMPILQSLLLAMLWFANYKTIVKYSTDYNGVRRSPRYGKEQMLLLSIEKMSAIQDDIENILWFRQIYLKNYINCNWFDFSYRLKKY